MIDLAVLQSTTAIPEPQPIAESTASTLRVFADGGLTIGAVYGLYRLGKQGIVAHAVPDGWDGDLPDTSVDRDPRALVLAALAYSVGVGLTSAAVYLTSTVAYTLAWAGAWSLIAAALALSAARDASPVDVYRLIAESRRNK